MELRLSMLTGPEIFEKLQAGYAASKPLPGLQVAEWPLYSDIGQ